MRRATCCLLFAAALLAVAPAFAEQVIHFTNGTAMPIRSYTIEGDMIHVDLGGNSFIAFPKSQVEKIVDAGGNAVGRNVQGSNRMVDGGEAVPARSAAPERRTEAMRNALKQEGRDDGIEFDENGTAFQRPLAHSPNPRKRELRTSANRNAAFGMNRNTAEGGYTGAAPRGNRNVIGAPSSRTGKAAIPIVTMQKSGGGAAPPPDAPPADSGSTDSGAGDSGSED